MFSSLLTDESVLMDLKALLVEAKQKVPPVLQVLQTGDETMLDIGGEPFIHSHVYIRKGCRNVKVVQA